MRFRGPEIAGGTFVCRYLCEVVMLIGPRVAIGTIWLQVVSQVIVIVESALTPERLALPDGQVDAFRTGAGAEVHWLAITIQIGGHALSLLFWLPVRVRDDERQSRGGQDSFGYFEFIAGDTGSVGWSVLARFGRCPEDFRLPRGLRREGGYELHALPRRKPVVGQIKTAVA